mgnify:CR=1 FL=1
MVLSGATGCESLMPEDADEPANDPGPNSRRVTGLDEKVRRPAASDNKRRARDSNPQPLAGHHISSAVAHPAFPVENADSDAGAAQGAAVAWDDPELVEIAHVWATLPPALKSAIVASVRASPALSYVSRPSQ